RAILKGAGNSVADAAARSDGEITVLVSKGEVSNLLDAVSGLNGGKIIKLMIGGDKTIPIRCGVIAFDVKEGQGTSKAMVVDTEQTRIEGAGGFDLGNERFDLRIAPKPKNPGILSLRTPVRLHGTFRDPDYQLEKKNLVLRVGGAVALAFIAPIAALLPLIETGPGSDAACGQLLDAAKEPAPEPGSKP
ncbi:MAG: AsmA family protein, partial [Burkholderiales bacterium]|nr:AsmA family protein [Burkholderiales bacterium]